ncbi:MAG: cupin domain-containing protein [Rhizobiaceae bacterium]|nr:cupin domain-containing protein [Rhizobiaceae bacterium]
MANLLILETSAVVPEEGRPAPEKLVGGTPTNRTWNVEDDGKGTYAGIWESTPGEWRISYTEWEFCHILAGVSVLTEDGGVPVTLKAGDSFVIRPGFNGTWNVVETTVKHYVIRL